ncbi:MAG: energy transducer TonB [Deltaproteobacteria bacterium]|nr:energy transducer TonB [Deltaproteobacteria bacterium]
MHERNQDPRRFRPIAVALVLALLAHAELVFTDLLPSMYRYWTSLFPRPEPAQSTEVTLVAMSPRDFELNRKLMPKVKVEERKEEEKPKAVPPEPEPEKPADKLDGQVVDLAPTPDSRPPEDARFLSEHNTRVDEESVSRHRRADYGVAQPRPTVADSATRRRSEPQEQPGEDQVALLAKQRGSQAEKSEYKSFAFEIPDIQKRDALNLKLDLAMGELSTYESSEALSGNSDRMRLQLGKEKADEESGEEGEDDRSVAMFKRPSLDKLDMVTGAPANDHIEDVPKGEQTLLNSREFKYATFFNRVKRGVSQFWAPRVGEEYIRRDPYGNIFGVKNRYTVLNVALDSSGKLTEVSVARSSGVKFFDDVAVRSFHDASPFPNPPQGLVGDDGSIRFQFGFYFEIGERPRIRAFQFERRPF